jgi:hypothetical protein
MNGETHIPTVGELGIAVRSERDIMGLVSAALSHPGLIVTEADLPAAFFDLKTGFAGELLQKLTNYAARVALVVPDPAVHGTRFSELAAEHRSHGLIRFVESEAEARRWFAELQ